MSKQLESGLTTLEGRIGRIASVLDEHQAEDIVVMDLRGICDFADAFVIVTARSSTHMQALVKTLYDEMRESGLRPLNRDEEQGATRWALLDYGDVVVHVFDRDARKYYDLEGLWGDADRMEWESMASA